MPYVWLGLMVLLIIIEAATMGLTTIWFAIGALFAFLVSLTHVHPLVQFGVFLVSSIILLYYTRPLAKKYLKVGSHATNVDSFIGREGVVIALAINRPIYWAGIGTGLGLVLGAIIDTLKKKNQNT